MKQIIGFQIRGIDEKQQHFEKQEFLESAIIVSQETILLEKENLFQSLKGRNVDELYLIMRDKSMSQSRIKTILSFRRKILKMLKQK